MIFKYFEFPLKNPSNILGKSIVRPIIPIRISFNGVTARYAALIDSGADFCIFDAEVGEYIGINIKSGLKEVFGGVQEVDGSVAFFHEITLSVGGHNAQALVGFSYDIAKHGYGLLGQKGFFDIFIVKFDLIEKQIEIKPRGISRPPKALIPPLSKKYSDKRLRDIAIESHIKKYKNSSIISNELQ